MKKIRVFSVLSLLILTVVLACTFTSCKKDPTPPDEEDPSPAVEHKAKDAWESDDTSHWHACTGCDEHVYDRGTHDFVASGNVKKCSVCQKEVTTGGDEENPPAPAHTAKEAWESDETSHWHACTECDEHIYDRGTHDYTANGKNKKCTVCQKEADYTEEENFLYFLIGRDFTLNYNGTYNIDYLQDSEETGEPVYRIIEKEMYGGESRYYYLRNDGYLSEDGTFSVIIRQLDVLRAVLDGTVTRAKYYTERQNFGETAPTCEGRYVSPRYFADSRSRALSPARWMEEFYITEGDDYESFIARIHAFAEEDDDTVESIVFARLDDGSVTLTVTIGSTTADEDAGETSIYRSVLRFTVTDGRIVYAMRDDSEECRYEDGEGNSAERVVTSYTLSYGTFDDEFLNAVPMETEETPNEYFAEVIINIKGYDNNFYYDDTLVGETLTAQAIADRLNARVGFLIGNDNGLPMFRLYTDEGCTITFTEAIAEEEMTLTLDFVAPEGYVTVVTAFRTQDGSTYTHTVYLSPVGERFFPRDLMKNYAILSIDGESDFECSSFFCAESRVHTVLYDNTYLPDPPTVEHRAVGDWIYSDAAHWHACSECRYETFDRAPHNFKSNGKNQKCTGCGLEKEYTAEENLLAFLEGINDALGFGNDCTATFVVTDSQDGIVSRRREGTESLSGMRYFLHTIAYLRMSEQDDLVPGRELLVAVKTVDVDGTARIKYYELQGGSARGIYKKPSYRPADEAKYIPSSFFDFCYFASDDLYADFCESMKAENLARFGYTLSEMVLERGDDGCVRLSFTATGEAQDGEFYTEEDGYLRTGYSYYFTFEVTDGELTHYTGVYRYTDMFSDETKNFSYSTEESIDYRTTFDEETYNGISVETETTSDEYVSSYDFVIEGYPMYYSMESVPVGKRISLDDIVFFLSDITDGRPLFNVSVDEAYRSMFKVYTDEAMTIPFESITTPDAHTTLYVRLDPPEDKAVVMTILDTGSAQAVFLCYLYDVGKTFRTSYVFQGSQVLTVEGVEVSDGETPPDIVCTENRIYELTFARS